MSPSATLPYIEARAEPASGAIQFDSFSLGGGSIEVSWGYRRCVAHDRSDGTGQDFATVRADDCHVVGVVADGVGQSFRGDLAAGGVAQRLLEWLWAERREPPDRAGLSAVLGSWAREIHRQVETVTISPELPRLIWLADEKARHEGAETVFSAFVYDSSDAVLHLYQVGDAPAVIHLSSGDPIVREAPPGGRWSSAGTADLQLLEERIAGVSRCVIHSDGLGEDWHHEIDGLSRETFEQIAEVRSEMDDVSFVAIHRLHEPPRPQTRKPPPAPDHRPEPPPSSPLPAAPGLSTYRRPQRRGPLVAAFLAGAVTGAMLLAGLNETVPESPAKPPPPSAPLQTLSPIFWEKLPSAPPLACFEPPTELWTLSSEAQAADLPDLRIFGGQVVLQIEAADEVAALEACFGPFRPERTFPPIRLGAALKLQFGLRGLGTDGSTLFDKRVELPTRPRNEPTPGKPLGLYKITVSRNERK